MGKLLEVRNLTKNYGKGTAAGKAVDAMNLDIAEQEFVIMMGASGSGKTSLLHLIAGIDDFDEGTIHYKNIDFGHMSEKSKTIFRRENIGIVFQQHFLIPDLTVYENIMCSICPVNLTKAGLTYNAETNNIEDRIRDWLVESPLNGFLFPAFDDRASNIHSILYYTKKAEEIFCHYLIIE